MPNPSAFSVFGSPVRSFFVASFAVVGVLAVQMFRHRFPALFTGAMAQSMSSSSKEAVSFCFVTAGSQEVADKLSSGLVSEKLAACVNIIPGIQSTYMWKGKVEKDNELLLIIKTRSALTKQVQEFVKANHPYELPEVICSQVTDGLPAYLQWVLDSTKDPSKD